MDNEGHPLPPAQPHHGAPRGAILPFLSPPHLWAFPSSACNPQRGGMMGNSQRVPFCWKDSEGQLGPALFQVRNTTQGRPRGLPCSFPIQVLTGLRGRSNQLSTSYAMTRFALWGGAPRHLQRMGLLGRLGACPPQSSLLKQPVQCGNRPGGRASLQSLSTAPGTPGTHSLGISTGAGPHPRVRA